MESDSIETMNRRLGKLEAEARRWRRVALALVVILIVGAARDDRPSKVIEADRFVLKDRDGKVRATLGVEPSGTTSLSFLDTNGNRRGHLGLRADGSPVLLLQGSKTEAGLSMGVSTEGDDETPGFALFGKSGTGGVQITTLRTGAPSISLHDTKDAARLSQELSADGAPAIKLLGPEQEGRTVGSIEVEAGGTTRLNLKGRDGKTLFEAPPR